MKTKSLQKILLVTLGEFRSSVYLKTITLFFVGLFAKVLPAQTILFDFDNAPLHSSLPIDQTSGGITAHLFGTGQSYSVQTADVLGFTPVGFSGYVVYPNSIYLADLLIKFDHTLTNFSIMYAAQELACDDAETMRVTAYMQGNYVGTNTMVARHPGTWPVDTLKCYFQSGFDSVVVHYDKKPPTCQDYGTIFMVDNMKVIPLADTTLKATINPSGTVSICLGTQITLQANTGVGYTYQWYKNGAAINGEANSYIIVDSAGSYTVKITSGASSVTSAATVVKTKPSPAAKVSPAGTTRVCPGVSIILCANTGTGLGYQWTMNDVAITGATQSSYSTTAPGNYNVIVTKTNGCSTKSNTAVIVNYAAASTRITYTGSLNICATGSVTFNAKIVSGYTYQWYKDNLAIGGATSTSYVATSAGVYNYLATTSKGCTAFSASKTVTGCASISASSTQKVESLFDVYPNPTKGDVIVTFYTEKVTPYLIKVETTVGKAVLIKRSMSSSGKNIQKLHLSGMAKGIYFITIETRDVPKKVKTIAVE